MSRTRTLRRLEPLVPCPRSRGHVMMIALLLPLLTGCGVSELQDEYGRRNGPGVFASVNGTAVFARMCEERGHKVFSWPLLSPRLENQADCIVWCPDDFSPPRYEHRQWLEGWLRAKPGRTLIHVGRHFDAVPWYWENVQGGLLSTEQQKEVGRRRKAARTDFAAEMSNLSDSENCQWFTLEGKYPNRPVTTLEGAPDWTAAADPTAIQMELNARVVPPDSAEVLLESEGDAIVFRRRVGSSRMIVVANGSFVLNAPLANHEHRRLAGKLIDEIGTPEKTVAFLESDTHLEISDSDPTFGPSFGFEVFHIWPMNWILIHVCLVGILLCYWRYPIFGRPIEPKTDSAADFGVHIAAVARLLSRTGDTVFAHTRLRHYRQTVCGESGSQPPPSFIEPVPNGSDTEEPKSDIQDPTPDP